MYNSTTVDPTLRELCAVHAARYEAEVEFCILRPAAYCIVLQYMSLQYYYHIKQYGHLHTIPYSTALHFMCKGIQNYLQSAVRRAVRYFTSEWSLLSS